MKSQKSQLKRGELTKEIKGLIEEMGTTEVSANQISEELEKRGYKCSVPLIYKVLADVKTEQGHNFSERDVQTARRFVKEIGSLSKAKKLIELFFHADE